MTNEEAIMWIENLIHTMKEETSGKCPDPAYKEEVYVALHMALEELKALPCEDCVSRQAVLEITAETGALETQTRVKSLPPVTPK